jgi:hypothetical protein
MEPRSWRRGGANDSRPELLDSNRFGPGAVIAGVERGRDLFRIDEADIYRSLWT